MLDRLDMRRSELGASGARARQEMKGKSVVVVGFGRTGRATATVLLSLGAEVRLADTRRREQLGALWSLAEQVGVPLACGDSAFAGPQPDLGVVSPGLRFDSGPWQEWVGAGSEAVSEVELAARLRLCPLIAVTGTNGKSTTTSMIGAALREAGIKTYVGGNIGDPLISQAVLAPSESWLVAEVSSFQLEGCSRFRPEVAVLLNIAPDHFDRYRNLSEYVRYKGRIFARQTPGDTAVVNADDRWARREALASAASLVEFSRRRSLEVGAYLHGDMLTLRLGGRVLPLLRASELGAKGTHNVENALAAAAAAAAAGGAPQAICAALREFQLGEHTMEDLGTFAGVRFINDSKATNPQATARALESLAGPIVLVGGGSGKGLDHGPLVPAMRNKVKGLVFMGATGHTLADVARAAGVPLREHATGMQEAVAKAAKMAVAGDTILLSPADASFDMFEDYADRGRRFKQAVAEVTHGTA